MDKEMKVIVAQVWMLCEQVSCHDYDWRIESLWATEAAANKERDKMNEEEGEELWFVEKWAVYSDKTRSIRARKDAGRKRRK